MNEALQTLIKLAMQEDFNAIGDATSQAIFTDETAHAQLLSKSTGILAGRDIFIEVFKTIDASVKVEFVKQDGDLLESMQPIAHVTGKALSILKGERIALNFISFMSGMATLAHEYAVEAKKYGKSVILDTRKTLPGYRDLSKYAVRVGGAENHRQGLYDMVMIKDNHIDAAGSIENAVLHVREKWNDQLKIEVECRTVEDVKEAKRLCVDVIMLDNMTQQEIEEAVQVADNSVLLEISGGVTFKELKDIVPLGATYISVGRLTHSAPAFDFSLKIVVE